MRGIWENVQPGMKLEVENRDVNHAGVAFWVASVIKIHGKKVQNKLTFPESFWDILNLFRTFQATKFFYVLKVMGLILLVISGPTCVCLTFIQVRIP